MKNELSGTLSGEAAQSMTLSRERDGDLTSYSSPRRRSAPAPVESA